MNQKSRTEEIIENLGLDWLPLLWGRQVFNTTPPPPDTAEIRQKLGSLSGDKLEEALKYCEALVQEEDRRLATIESKAFTLISISGIATAFITGFAALLLDRAKIGSIPIALLAAAVYIVIVFSLIFTIYIALKVVIIGQYRFSHPHPSRVFNLAEDSIKKFRQERAVSLYFSYVTNSGLINVKGTFLGGAQLWFRNSIVMLLLLTFLLALYAPFNPQGVTFPLTPSPTVTPVFTPTIGLPSPTP